MLAHMNWIVVAILAVLFCVSGEAFVVGTQQRFVHVATTRSIAAGAGFGTGRRRAEGKVALRMVDVVVEFTKTGKTVTAVVGAPLSQMCAKAGVKVKYNCKQGDCATCVINIDGRNVKACQGKVPASRRIVKIKA